MALFESRQDLYEYELSQFGVTYCDDSIGGDRLIIAPKLQRHPWLADEVTCDESPLEMLQYLRVRGELIGVSYAHLAGMFIYYMNGYVPDEFPIRYVSDLFLLGVNDPEDSWCVDDAQFKAARDICEAVYDLVSSMPPLPPVIVERMRNHIAQKYHKNVLH